MLILILLAARWNIRRYSVLVSGNEWTLELAFLQENCNDLFMFNCIYYLLAFLHKHAMLLRHEWNYSQFSWVYVFLWRGVTSYNKVQFYYSSWVYVFLWRVVTSYNEVGSWLITSGEVSLFCLRLKMLPFNGSFL